MPSLIPAFEYDIFIRSVKERMEKAKAYAGVTVEPFELLFPVPFTEIQISNGTLTQNPGY